jgi:hypothetical protein
MPQVVIEIDQKTYDVTMEKAVQQGYHNIEAYLGDLVDYDASDVAPMTPELAAALEEGLADARAGRIMTFEEHERRIEQVREDYVQDNIS